MKRSTRMMLMKDADKRWNGQESPERENGYDDGPRSEYAPEDRFRDRRGREHYDDGRYAPRNDSGYMPRNDGEYMPRNDGYPSRMGGGSMRQDDGNYPRGSRYPYYPGPYSPPYYNEDMPQSRDTQPVRMHKIGFSIDGEMERKPDEFQRDYPAIVPLPSMNEMNHRQGSYMAGRGEASSVQPIDKRTAEEWAKNMQNEDGTTGPHWTMEQTKQVQAQKGIDCDPVKFWVAMNASYSDLCKFFKKHNINSIDAYVDYALAFWFDDKDAQKDKLERYYQYVVKH